MVLNKTFQTGCLFLLFSAVTVKSRDNYEFCGTNLDSDRFIPEDRREPDYDDYDDYGGDSIAPRITSPSDLNTDPVGTWPWMASAGRFEGDGRRWQHYCGGAIISRKFVLTAAHCTVIEGLSIRMGDRNLNDPDDDVFGTVRRRIRRTIVHPSYRPQEAKGYYDVALWELAPRIAFNKFVRPICLPPPPRGGNGDLDKFAGHQVTVTGWGFTSRNSGRPEDILRAIPIKIFPQKYCNRSHTETIAPGLEQEVQKHIPQLFPPSLLCAGYERPLFGPCKGDSGSPLVRQEFGGAWPQYVVQGIVQGGLGQCGDKDLPAIFTRVKSDVIYQFILDNVGNGVYFANESDTRAPNPTVTFPPLDLREYTREQYDPRQNNLEVDSSLGSFGGFLDTDFRSIVRQIRAGTFKDDYVSNKTEELPVLTKAVKEGDRIFPVAKLLVFEVTKDINAFNTKKTTALEEASKGGHDQMVKLLLANGADVSKYNVVGFAATRGHKEVLEILLSFGASIEGYSPLGRTPLLSAIFGNKFEIVEYLLSKGANPNAQETSFGWGGLHLCTWRNGTQFIASALLNAGAKLEARNNDEETPYMMALKRANVDLAKYLESRGADKSVINFNRETILHVAVQSEAFAAVKYVLSTDIGKQILDNQNRQGYTALMQAAERGQEAQVSILVYYGADRRFTNNRGQNAHDLAVQGGFTKVANILSQGTVFILQDPALRAAIDLKLVDTQAGEVILD